MNCCESNVGELTINEVKAIAKNKQQGIGSVARDAFISTRLFPIGSKFFSTALCATLFSTLMISGNDSQAEVTVIPSLAFQDKQLTFEQKYSGGASNEAEFTAHLPMVYAGITLAANRFYLSFKMEQSLSTTSTSTNETDLSEFDQPNLMALNGSKVEVERRDMAITLGYEVIENLNAFIGYLDGQTNLTPNPFCANPNASAPCSRSNRAFQQFYLEDNDFVAGLATYEQTYSESGFYAGAAYGIPVADIGTITLSLAYAIMDGEYKDNASDPNQNWEDFDAFHYEGDATGVSFGTTWTSGLNEYAAYFVDLRLQSYSMEGEDDVAGMETITLETEEKMFGVTAGIQLYF